VVDDRARDDLAQVRRHEVRPLPQDRGDERQRETRAVDRQRAPEIAQQVRERTDVVEVPVGQEHRLDVVAPLEHPTPVREDQVDTEMLGIGEQHSTVDDGDAALDLDGGHVAADAAQSPEERDLDRRSAPPTSVVAVSTGAGLRHGCSGSCRGSEGVEFGTVRVRSG